MSRRSTPERIRIAHCAATLERLVSAGDVRERAERRLAEWEATQPAGERLDYEVTFLLIVDQAARG